MNLAPPPPLSSTRRTTSLSFFSVIRFASRYWLRQPKKLAVILLLLISASILETYLPTALSAFLGAIRQQQSQSSILSALALFLGAYALQATLFSTTYFIYNSFETRIFKSLMDDAFVHVYSLSEHFFVNTFTGSIISKINRARQKIENFEDQVILRIFPTLLILIGSTLFLALRFPTLALLMALYLCLLMAVSAFFVFHISGPAQGIYADAQDAFIAHLADGVSGIATTKAYAQEKHEFGKFFDITRLLRLKNVRAYTLGTLATLVQRILLTGMLGLLLGGGTWYFVSRKSHDREHGLSCFCLHHHSILHPRTRREH